MAAVNTLVDMSASERENAVRLDDPALRRFPFLYMLEIEGMSLTPPEVEGLSNYLRAGGFLVVDDFWGAYAFANLEREMRRVLPSTRSSKFRPTIRSSTRSIELKRSSRCLRSADTIAAGPRSAQAVMCSRAAFSTTGVA